MENLKGYYSGKQKEAAQEHVEFRKKINILVAFRVLVFVAIALNGYFWWSQPVFLIPSVLLLSGGFLFLLKKYSEVEVQLDYWDAVHTFYSNELRGLEGDFEWAGNGTEYKVPNHAFSNDIDLFGPKSFFNRINRTATQGGEEVLAQKLSANDNSGILEKQLAVAELSEKLDFIEAFVGNAKTNESDLPANVIQSWFENYQPTFNQTWMSLLFIFPLISVVLLVVLAGGIISGVVFTGWFIFGLLITGRFLRNSVKFSTDINRIVSNIKSYNQLLTLIEKESWKSSKLVEIRDQIVKDQNEASLKLRAFSRKVDLFNNRNNFIVGIFGNALLLWDLQTISRIERWIVTNRTEIKNWIYGIYELDAYISLAIYKFNHPEYTFPEIEFENTFLLEANGLGHPLIQKESCVTNDIKIDQENFLIITGANMAGKSTFLRTISLSIIMTNVGLPVFATSFRICPQKLISSMRTSDSLIDDESYFFAELKRLKFIIDTIEKESHFIILDEILKGTNSKDKEEGSKQFVKKLISMQAGGIIATHDLGLCTIDQEFDNVKNYYFDAEIIDDELHFDYLMKYGVCKNMNASFLLRKMKIVDA